MRRVRPLVFGAVVALLAPTSGLVGCGTPTPSDQTAEDQREDPASAEGVAEAAFVHRYLAAFNGHEADLLADLMHEQIEVYYVDENGSASIGTRGREAMREELTSYFERFPDVKSHVANDIAISGRFLSFSEEVSWRQDADTRTQTAMTVLELEGEQLRRAWYFPAHRPE